MLDKISWLHLSDFHFRAGSDDFSQKVSCVALARDIPSRLSDEYPLQFIAVTGDIAFSGQPSEYEPAFDFFVSLLDSLGLDATRLCIVPGNHDIDRAQQSYLYDGVRSRLTNQRDVDEFLGKETERTQLLERQLAFREFRDRLVVDGQETNERLARVRHFDFSGLRVCVLEMNSAWLSGERDHPGNLLVGERQVIGALTLAESYSPHLTVALTHHPIDWLAEFDRTVFSNRIVPQVDIFHSGHLHSHQASIMLTPGSQCIHSAAGSSHETRHYRNAYNIFEYDIGNATCRIRQFEYEADSGEFRESQGIEHRLPPRGERQSRHVEIEKVLREDVPATESHAGYMASLLTGGLEEVPILLDDTLILASKNLPAEYQIPVVGSFLRTANLLQVFDTVPLQEMIASQESSISGFATFLNNAASADSDFAKLLAGRELQARKLSAMNLDESPIFQEQYLVELETGGDLEDAIETATRYQQSLDANVRISASRHLARALLRHDDLKKKKDGAELAFQNLDEDWADSSDYILASAAADSLGDSAFSESIALRALETWPKDPDVRTYCRSLATQRGSQALRQRLDRTGGNG